jgi:type VI secretion system secreted protein Hcp
MLKYTLVTLALLATTLAATSYLTIDGSRQGKFISSDYDSSKIKITDFEMEVTSARDAASGLATGRRVYKPISVSKKPSLSSPQQLQAVATNENLKSVVIETYSLDTTNPPPSALTQKITLTNAALLNFKQTSDADGAPQELLTFTFSRIEMSNSNSAYVDQVN